MIFHNACHLVDERFVVAGTTLRFRTTESKTLIRASTARSRVYPFLSAVDNGWLATALIMVTNTVPQLRDQAQALVSSMNFKCFLNPGDNLLKGGFWLPNDQPGGTVMGVLILGLIQALIAFKGDLNTWWTKIATAVLLLIFCLFQKVFERKQSKRTISGTRAAHRPPPVQAKATG